MDKGIARDMLLLFVIGLAVLFLLLVITGKAGDAMNKVLDMLKLKVG